MGNGKKIRWVPPNSLVEISCRCIQSRFLLRPSPELNEIFLGVLILALRRSGVRIHYIFVMSCWEGIAPKERRRRVASTGKIASAE